MNANPVVRFQERVLLFILLSLTVIVSGCVSEAPETSEDSAETQETQPKTQTDLGDFKLVYDTVSTAEHDEYEQIFKDSGLFEVVVNELNDVIILPFDVSVVFVECETPNAFYDPTSKQIAMCYELINEIALDLADVAETEEELGFGIVHTLLFLFYHELGHALIDIHDLPITGREEDAVDQLSTLILVEAGAEGEKAVLNGAFWFLLRAEKTDLDASAFADEHTLDAQRFYNLACWVYGKNPQMHSYVVEERYLTEERAVRCGDEYLKMSNSWNRLLRPYLK